MELVPEASIREDICIVLLHGPLGGNCELSDQRFPCLKPLGRRHLAVNCPSCQSREQMILSLLQYRKPLVGRMDKQNLVYTF